MGTSKVQVAAEQATKVCVLCGEQFTGWGNNPWPLAPASSLSNERSRCCDDCNWARVIPARIAGVVAPA